MKKKIKLYNLYRKGPTKWGNKKPMSVSFQKLGDKFCCFQGDGSEENVIGWGETKKEAAENLIKNMGISVFPKNNVIKINIKGENNE